MDFSKFNFITQQFFINSKVLNIDVIESGLINKTYIVQHLYKGKKSKFILQNLSNIFDSYETVNMNHKLITDHIAKKQNENHFVSDWKRWDVPNLIKCKSNDLFVFSYDSSYWRAMIYIDQTFSIENLEDEIMAYQTGIGLSKFHMLCSDLDCSKLKNSIKNFHNINYYIDQYITTLQYHDFLKFSDKVNQRVQNLIHNISNQIQYVQFLLRSLRLDLLDHNVIHGDPKLSNFLFDIDYKYVVSLIDLDTVSSGYLLTDLADCIRSICNLAGEDPEYKDNVCFDINSCIYFLKGYLSISNKMKNHSYTCLPEFIYLIIFELTIRFLTDFLQSNKYFKIRYETHNLFRAEVQYRLLASFLTNIHEFSIELNKVGIYPSSTFVSDVQKFV